MGYESSEVAADRTGSQNEERALNIRRASWRSTMPLTKSLTTRSLPVSQLLVQSADMLLYVPNYFIRAMELQRTDGLNHLVS